ncbi:MAG: DegT/DnrJ/EryC1/StrS family aminotransferase [Planctomycetes bacterium]|nr:DegT/DnrJ/EryC1/StrS family aminotransferase [Planctomycetota bacterium]
MKIPLVDLQAEYAECDAEVRRAVEEVLTSRQFIGGPAVAEFESELADYCQCRHAIAVGTGSDAVLLALMAVGVGEGDEVITTPFTFFATAGSIARLGAKPVFVDIEPDTFNIDAAKVEAAVTERTKAILPVHLFGQCAEMNEITHLAEKRSLAVVEDAAQAIGATQRGHRAGSFGKIGSLSFYPTKNLNTVGEGGAVLTSDDRLAERCRQLRNHGETSRYHHAMIGGNFRLDTLKAAVLRVKLQNLDRLTDARRRHASAYGELLADCHVSCPVVRDYNESVFHQYSVLVDDRDGLKERLSDEGIGAGVYYPVPLHRQECFTYLGYRQGDFPVAEFTADRILSIPVHPFLTDEQIQLVAKEIRLFFDTKT